MLFHYQDPDQQFNLYPVVGLSIRRVNRYLKDDILKATLEAGMDAASEFGGPEVDSLCTILTERMLSFYTIRKNFLNMTN